MDNATKRLGMTALSIASLAAFLSAAHPRVVAWNEASTAATIASQRAANCRVLSGPVQPNTIPVDGRTGKPLNPGVHVCSWDGTTGQINGAGAIDYVKQGHIDTIAQILKSRGFKTTN